MHKILHFYLKIQNILSPRTHPPVGATQPLFFSVNSHSAMAYAAGKLFDFSCKSVHVGAFYVICLFLRAKRYSRSPVTLPKNGQDQRLWQQVFSGGARRSSQSGHF